MTKMKLVQTLVSPDALRKLDSLARAQGRARASYLRKILQDHALEMSADTPPRTARPIPADYPLPEVDLPPGSSTTVFTTVPTELGPFRPARLVFPDALARHLVVTNVKIGKNSQLLSTGCLPGDFFAESAPDVNLYFDALSAGLCLYLSVTNTSPKKLVLRGSVRGQHHAPAPHGATRNYVLGLGWDMVLPRREFRVRAQSQVLFHPEILFVPPRLHPGLEVLSVTLTTLRCGAFNDDGPVPLRPPSYEKEPANLLEKRYADGRHTLRPGSLVTYDSYVEMLVRNRSPRPTFFSGAVLGPPAK